jgi:hypothetical protein
LNPNVDSDLNVQTDQCGYSHYLADRASRMTHSILGVEGE